MGWFGLLMDATTKKVEVDTSLEKI